MTRTLVLVIVLVALLGVSGLYAMGSAVEDVRNDPNSSANDSFVNGTEDTTLFLYEDLTGALVLILLLAAFVGIIYGGFS